MTNFEYYKEKLLEASEADYDPVITTDGHIANCNEMDCHYCIWYSATVNCNAARFIWGYSEYKAHRAVEINLDGLKSVLTEE